MYCNPSSIQWNEKNRNLILKWPNAVQGNWTVYLVEIFLKADNLTMCYLSNIILNNESALVHGSHYFWVKKKHTPKIGHSLFQEHINLTHDKYMYTQSKAYISCLEYEIAPLAVL